MDNELVSGGIYEFLAEALACIGDGVIATGVNENILYMNLAAVEVTGWKAEEAINQKFDLVFPITNSMTKRHVESPVKKALDMVSKVGLENNSILTGKDGSKRFISATCSPIRDSEGFIDGVVIVFRDINRLKHIEEDLIHERNNLKLNFDSNPMGMLIVDKTAIVTQANPAFINMVGHDPDGVIGHKIGNGFGCINGLEKGCGCGEKCKYCKLQEAIETVLQTGEPNNNVINQDNMTKKGVIKKNWYKINYVPITVQGQNLVMVAFDDITEHKRNEEKIIQSKDYYMKILEDFPMLIWRSNMEKQLDYFNKGWLSFTGKSMEEEVGDGWKTDIHPDDLDNVVEAYLKNYEMQQPFELELRLRRHDGEYRSMLGAGRPLYDIEDNFTGYVGGILDITERKMAETLIKESHRKFEQLFMNMLHGFAYYRLIYDETGNIADMMLINANNAFVEISGLNTYEMMNKTFLETYPFIKGSEFNRMIGLMKEASHSGLRIKEYYMEPLNKCYSLSLYSPEKDHIALIIEDVTETKKAKEQLEMAKKAAEEANKAKSEFLANMTHEIRTPLNGIVGMIDLTMLTELNKEQTENLNIAKSCARNLLKIINDILDFSKMEAGKLVVENIDFNIKQLVEDTVKAQSVRADDKGIELSYSFSSNIPQYLVGDPNRLQQVLNNLVNNAIKFSENGEVVIRVKKAAVTSEAVELQFSVSDTGIGISEDEIGRLFKSFSQVDSSYTRKFGGTGLGLVISKQLVEMMGGKMWVESEKGIGSTFYFSISYKIGSKPAEKPAVYSTAPKAVKVRDILLVEDDKVNQTVLSRMLIGAGHNVDIASNGLEALATYENKRYDVILMDIQLPEMDGIEATKRIREKEGTEKHTPIIALTAFALHGDREKFIGFGMDEYVPKPVKMEELFRTINKICDKYVEEPDFSERPRLGENGELVFVSEIRLKSREEIEPIICQVTENIKKLSEVIASGDIHAIEATAHNIKDLFSRIDAEEMKGMAFRIELASRRGNLKEIVECAMQINYKFEIYKKSLSY